LRRRLSLVNEHLYSDLEWAIAWRFAYFVDTMLYTLEADLLLHNRQ
jgi:hypothetical protein